MSDQAMGREELERIFEDANRFRWITTDHDGREARERCREILQRMTGMSYSAAGRDIDILRKEYPIPELPEPPDISTDAALREELQQLREKYDEYFQLQCPIVQPSCLMCGQQKEFTIKHLKLGSVGICVDCVALREELAKSEEKYRQDTGDLGSAVEAWKREVERLREELAQATEERDRLCDTIGSGIVELGKKLEQAQVLIVELGDLHEMNLKKGVK